MIAGCPGSIETSLITLRAVGTPRTAVSIGLSGWAPAAAAVSKLNPDAITRLARNRACRRGRKILLCIGRSPYELLRLGLLHRVRCHTRSATLKRPYNA